MIGPVAEFFNISADLVYWLVGFGIVHAAGLGAVLWLIDRIASYVLTFCGAYRLLMQASFEIMKRKHRERSGEIPGG